MNLIQIVEQKGYWKVSKMTKPNTYRIVHKSSFGATSLQVRDNVGWAVAELILVDELCTDEDEIHILQRWRILVSGDPIQPSSQKLVLTNDGATYKLYNSAGTIVNEGDILDIIPSVKQKPRIYSCFENYSLQLISYGAPGTGKSKCVDDIAAKLSPEDVVRTTFHPDSDYASFVGAYKPKMVDVPRSRIDGDEIKKITKGDAQLLTERQISYEFVPQAFTKAYVQAWRRMAAPAEDGKVSPVMLVIEEINRGDCAKIFGDLFQLLDRRMEDDPNDKAKGIGFSEYPVLADGDLADCIRRALTDTDRAAIAAQWPRVVAKECLELVLPPNLHIWATMNTSDQSLFPMDSAFKRRWDWRYFPIKDHPKEGWTIAIGEKRYSWWDFLVKVNREVFRLTSSEDKQLGYFFVRAADKTVNADTFVNKVLFFLWNGVFKDCVTECDFLKNGDDYFSFRDFFEADGRAHTAHIAQFLKALTVEEAQPF